MKEIRKTSRARCNLLRPCLDRDGGATRIVHQLPHDEPEPPPTCGPLVGGWAPYETSPDCPARTGCAVCPVAARRLRPAHLVASLPRTAGAQHRRTCVERDR